MTHFKSPIDESPITIQYDNNYELIIQNAEKSTWRTSSLEQRIAICKEFLKQFKALESEIIPDLTLSMGRPIDQNINEIRGTLDRAEYLISIASEALAPTVLPDKPGFKRYIKKVPLGVVFVIAPWNYPYLCMVNSVVPALLAGNTAFRSAGLSADALQSVNCNHETAAKIIKHPSVQFVQFTGSVRGGMAVKETIASKFIGAGFELGGKDPAYVRADADIQFAAENIVDGACYNSGQSCCAVERVYVHSSVYEPFVEACVKVAKNYKLGDPRVSGINLGPVISSAAAANIASQINDAVSKGAKTLLDPALYPNARAGSAYVAPQILVNVNHGMELMKQETFGPVFGIMSVGSDQEAIELMNDSEYGLTASIWSKDLNAVENIADHLETGTVFMNRCDCLDPGLAWVGVKNSGVGVSLSRFGFDSVTRAKSYHLRL